MTTNAGRFAPSPTGDLHFGSLLAAMASYCEARSCDARWHLRIDDIDGPRSVAESPERIQQSLLNYGMQWDGDVQWQSQHTLRYENALAQLINQGLVFSCNCSRKSLPAGKIYPGTCRANRVRSEDGPVVDRALRLRLPDALEFTDGIQGLQSLALREKLGDIIVWRRDGLVSYSLACAVDDATDCTQIIRGADLLPSTAAQLAIINYLALPAPRYAHIPVAVNENDDKLSKHSNAASIDTMDPVITLHRAWRFLGQSPFHATDLSEFWSKASSLWQLSRVPGKLRKAESANE